MPPIPNQSTEMTPVETNKEDFMTAKWRPAMGWTYMCICMFDFMVGPVMNVVFSIMTKTPLQAWKSLTLDNGGLFHMAMGAILGVAAWSRGQEKIAKLEASTGPNAPMPSPSMGPAAALPDPVPPARMEQNAPVGDIRSKSRFG